MAREFMVPPKLITGTDALKEAVRELGRMGKKALIVTGPHLEKLGKAEELRKELKK